MPKELAPKLDYTTCHSRTTLTVSRFLPPTFIDMQQRSFHGNNVLTLRCSITPPSFSLWLWALIQELVRMLTGRPGRSRMMLRWYLFIWYPLSAILYFYEVILLIHSCSILMLTSQVYVYIVCQLVQYSLTEDSSVGLEWLSCENLWVYDVY